MASDVVYLLWLCDLCIMLEEFRNQGLLLAICKVFLMFRFFPQSGHVSLLTVVASTIADKMTTILFLATGTTTVWPITLAAVASFSSEQFFLRASENNSINR
jgi:hypothetical protein